MIYGMHSIHPPDKPSDDLHLTPAMFVQLKDAVASPFAAEHEDDKMVSLVRYNIQFFKQVPLPVY